MVAKFSGEDVMWMVEFIDAIAREKASLSLEEIRSEARANLAELWPPVDPVRLKAREIVARNLGKVGDANFADEVRKGGSPASPLRSTEGEGAMSEGDERKEYIISSQCAAATQVDGDHYTRLAIQPFEYSMRNGLNPLQHTVIKYVTRYADKGGRSDLLKARHCIDLLMAHEGWE